MTHCGAKTHCYINSLGAPTRIPHYCITTLTPPLTITMSNAMSVVEHADRLMQVAGALFSDKKSIMKNDYVTLAEDHMLW